MGYKKTCTKIFKGAPKISNITDDNIGQLSKNYKDTIKEIILIDDLEIIFADKIYMNVTEAHSKYGIDKDKKPINNKGWRLPYIKEFKHIVNCDYIKDRLIGKFHVLDKASSLDLIYEDFDNVFFAPQNQYITSALDDEDMGYVILVRKIRR